MQYKEDNVREKVQAIFSWHPGYDYLVEKVWFSRGVLGIRYAFMEYYTKL